MKKKTTAKFIKEKHNKIFKCGYCELQQIFQNVEPKYYTCGVYGWNFDCYVEEGIAITTGYRGMVGKDIPKEIIEKYDNIATEILTNLFEALVLQNRTLEYGQCAIFLPALLVLLSLILPQLQ